MNELTLIEVVKRHEALYNNKLSEYCDATARHAAWSSVAEECGSTIDCCKEAWSKLRNCYTNAKKRRKRNSCRSIWRFEEEMSFLEPHLKARPNSDEEEVIFVEDTWERGSCSTESVDRISVGLEREHLLIELIRRYEVIYNTKCRAYRNIKERHAAWLEIADLHGSTVSQCKLAWVKLRNCYTNAIKRQHIRSAKKLPITPWRFEKEMSFLRPYLNLRFDTYDQTEGLLYDDEDSWETSLSPKPMTPDIDTSAIKSKESQSNFFEVVDLEDRSLVYEKNLDDTDHFFLSMSKMVKKLPKVDQLRIKLDLHKAINDAELRALEVDGASGTSDATKQNEVKREVSTIGDATRGLQYLHYD